LTDVPTTCSVGAQPEIPVRLTVIATAATSAVLLSGCFPGDNSTKPLAAQNQNVSRWASRGAPQNIPTASGTGARSDAMGGVTSYGRLSACKLELAETLQIEAHDFCGRRT
jgi:hypothetical protein